MTLNMATRQATLVHSKGDWRDQVHSDIASYMGFSTIQSIANNIMSKLRARKEQKVVMPKKNHKKNSKQKKCK